MCHDGMRTVVFVAQVDELLLELGLDLFECLDGFLLRLVGRPQLDGVCRGLHLAVSGIEQ